MAKSKINTKDVVKEVAARMGCYQKDADEVITHLAEVIAEAIKEDKAVGHKELGIFRVTTTKKGNKLVKFRPGKALLDRVEKREGR